MSGRKAIVLTGACIGALAALLVYLGNPANMGICVACFIRDIAGALGLHRTEVVQYIRPEILGFILGSFIIAAVNKEFRATGGSSPLVRFVLGAFVMIGALVFLGCPLRMVLRLAGGDLNALVGLIGFAAGVLVGTEFIKHGFSLGRSYQQKPVNGYILPAVAAALFVMLVAKPAFIFASTSGPGSQHATAFIALAMGLIVGIMAQRSRLCMAGGIRDIYLIRDPHLVLGFIAIFAFALIFNVILGNFQTPGFTGQPIAHNDGLWNFLGMLLTGFGSVLLGGCPLRQTILAGEGNTDSALTFLGMLVGSAFAHNFGLAATPAGVSTYGKIAVVIGIATTAIIGFSYIKKDVKLEIRGDERVEA